MWFNNLVNYNPVTKIIEGILKSSKLLSDFVDYFANLFCKNCPNNIGNILFGLGVTSVTFSTLAFFFRFYQNWKWIPSHFANRKTVNK